MIFINKSSIFRLLLIEIMFLLTVTAGAQSSHMTFQGIPIDGHMSDFMQKLEAKGWKYDFENNLHTNDFGGEHKLCYYTGVYNGYPCRLHFEYKRDSKIVCSVHLEIGCETKEKAEEIFKILKKKNDVTYKTWDKTIVDFNIFECYYWGNKVGYISVSIDSGVSADPFPYGVDISFTDIANNSK